MTSTVLERVDELARGTANGDGDALAAFARAYLHGPSATDGLPADSETVLAEIRGAFTLAAGRRRAPVALRAFTPDRGEDGYDPRASVLETATPDQPFLVDSVSAELRARGLGIHRLAHPIVGVVRDAAGAITAVTHPREAPRESVMHFELDRTLGPDELAALEDAVRGVLDRVRACADDAPGLLAGLDRLRDAVIAADPPDRDEELALLDWLGDGHFVALGFREGDRPGLGLLRDGAPAPADLEAGDAALRIGRTATTSPVHRRAPLVAVRAGDALVLGLFTLRAEAESASAVPVLRRKLAAIVEAEDLVEGSYDQHAATAVFDAFPLVDLLATPVGDLRAAVAALLGAGADEIRILDRREPGGRGAAVAVGLPREAAGADLRERLRAAVQGLFGVPPDVHEERAAGDRVQLHLALRSTEPLPDVPKEELERRLLDLARSWEDRARGLLAAEHGTERGGVLAARWVRRLPEPYRAAVEPDVAARDVVALERLYTQSLELVVTVDGAGERTRVTFVKRGAKIELSQATPMLEDLGLRVIEELPARLDGEPELWLQAFTVAAEGLEAAGERVAEALVAVWEGASESDSLNRLVVSAGLTWPQVEILRAYRRYRQRLGSRYTEAFQNDVIAAHPELTAKLVRYFELRFGPEADAAAEAAVRDEVLAGLDGVDLLDHDRILRNQLGIVAATVRTNAYKPGRDALAFKVRSADVPAVPQPPPLFEIYVYARDMEGIHLRGGRIARGGLRFSDRMDYRTEVFGLMRAQVTKNAVIVPTGAKGGFIIKEGGRGAQDVRRQYVRYVEALLDVTDNLVDGEVEPPTGVRVHDEPDTYLVVAADKGTAALSDTANEVAVGRGFWLGDAFASGGSAGYDHKALGITAKGAWESVKRHFRDLGVDPEADPVTVVGIGDMSGDVFGNGMLRSRTLRLVAAYDHRHVFLDPDPDPERSFAERERLFALPGSTWDDFDRAVLSEGGGVWSRERKEITLPPQARAVLGLEGDEPLAPADVIRAILRAPVDLLFNGGIGTVVKASTESDADAQDRAGDAIRVDARDLRARVVAEGGNLGLTQRARIEYARDGGRVNADFIDNSAGVDCSDHEVNLKILLDLGVRRGRLEHEQRDGLLREVTDDVVAHVLYDSFLQAQILGQEERRAPSRLYAYEDLMEELETTGEPPRLVRALEALPAPDEMAERRRDGSGLARPELAVLLAHAKRHLTDALLASALPDEPHAARDVRGYFPAPVVERLGDLIAEHPLHRELAATTMANDVVDALGTTFVSGLAKELGAHPADVVRAFRIAREVSGATLRWMEVEGLGPEVAREAARALMDGVDDLVAELTRWYLLHPVPGDVEATVAAGHGAFAELADAMPDLRSDGWREDHDARAARLIEQGVDPALARRHAHAPALLHAPAIIAVAARTGRDVVDVAFVAFGLGEALNLEWLEQACDGAVAATRISRWAIQAVRDELLAVRCDLTALALAEAPDAAPEDAVAAFLEARAAPLRRLAGVARTLAREGGPDLAGLTLALRHLRTLAS